MTKLNITKVDSNAVKITFITELGDGLTKKHEEILTCDECYEIVNAINSLFGR